MRFLILIIAIVTLVVFDTARSDYEIKDSINKINEVVLLNNKVITDINNKNISKKILLEYINEYNHIIDNHASIKLNTNKPDTESNSKNIRSKVEINEKFIFENYVKGKTQLTEREIGLIFMVGPSSDGIPTSVFDRNDEQSLKNLEKKEIIYPLQYEGYTVTFDGRSHKAISYQLTTFGYEVHSTLFSYIKSQLESASTSNDYLSDDVKKILTTLFEKEVIVIIMLADQTYLIAPYDDSKYSKTISKLANKRLLKLVEKADAFTKNDYYYSLTLLGLRVYNQVSSMLTKAPVKLSLPF